MFDLKLDRVKVEVAMNISDITIQKQLTEPGMGHPDGWRLLHTLSFQHILVHFMHQLSDHVKFCDKRW